jgi:hypothetical protein
VVGCKLMRVQDALHRTQADPDGLRQQARRPVGRFSRGGPNVRSTTFNGLRRQRLLPRLAPLSRRSPSTPSAINRATSTQPAWACPTAPCLSRAAPFRCGKDDLGPPHMFLWRAPVCHNRLKATAIFRRDVHEASVHPAGCCATVA